VQLHIQETTAKRILTPTGGFLDGFTHTLQPYTGCPFACFYCYVRRMPAGLFGRAPWGAWLDVKRNAPALLRQELRLLHGAGKPVRVYMSSATDPYNGGERRYHVTRGCLEVFCDMPPRLLVVQTRSPLVRRDYDLLGRIPHAWLSMTIETDDDRVRRQLTPLCPSIDRRAEAVRQAKAAGIRVQVTISPLLPCNEERLMQMLLDLDPDFVIVDTLYLGDGAHGKRSEALGCDAVLAQHGYQEWARHDRYERLLSMLRTALREERVGLSKDGFNKWARRMRS
jgi:DNA repair photolyase